jgi:hypothetical protein
MLSLDDNRWNNLTGGYKTRFDPVHCLLDLRPDGKPRQFGAAYGMNCTIRGTWETHHTPLCRNS